MNIAAKVKVSRSTEPKNIEAGTSAKLNFAFQEKRKNVPLEISHVMKVHLKKTDEILFWFRCNHTE